MLVICECLFELRYVQIILDRPWRCKNPRLTVVAFDVMSDVVRYLLFPLNTCSVELRQEKPSHADQLTPFFKFTTLDRLTANRLPVFRPRKRSHQRNR